MYTYAFFLFIYLCIYIAYKYVCVSQIQIYSSTGGNKIYYLLTISQITLPKK